MTRKFLRTLLLAMLVLCMSAPAFPALATDQIPTLEIFIEERVTVEDYDTNAATLWLQEQLGCELEFIIAPTGSATEKMNILLNSGEYPDVFYRSVPDLNLYGSEAGILLELSDYVYDAEKMPYLAYIMEIRPNLMPQMKTVDGGIYALPGYTECYHCLYSTKMFYNKALLDELGLAAPTTTDEFYAACVAFKEAYPEGIAFATNAGTTPWAFLINAWTYNPTSALGLRNHNGTIESILDDDEYREALRYIKKLYEEDLLYEASFTQDTAQMKALLASETPVLFWTAGNNVSFVDGAATPELYANQKPVAPLKGPEGAQYTTYYMPSPYNGAAITSTCEYPDLAVKFVDLHYSVEGFWVTNEGREGEEWAYAEPGQTSITGVPAIANRLGAYITDIQNVKWEPGAIQMQIDEIQARWFDEATYDENDVADGASFRSIMTRELYAPYYQEEYQTLPRLAFTTDESEESSMITATLQNYVEQSRIAFITGEMSLDSDWDSYVASLKNMGLDTLIQLNQTAYDRAN